MDLTSAIRSEGLALGFDAIGFAPAESSEDAKAWLAEYLKSGMHGDMGWMANQYSKIKRYKILE